MLANIKYRREDPQKSLHGVIGVSGYQKVSLLV